MNKTRQATAVPNEAQPRDVCTRDGAEALARDLTAWWHARGFPQVQHWVAAVPAQGAARKEPVWAVRSNLINGLPP